MTNKLCLIIAVITLTGCQKVAQDAPESYTNPIVAQTPVAIPAPIPSPTPSPTPEWTPIPGTLQCSHYFQKTGDTLSFIIVIDSQYQESSQCLLSNGQTQDYDSYTYSPGADDYTGTTCKLIWKSSPHYGNVMGTYQRKITLDGVFYHLDGGGDDKIDIKESDCHFSPGQYFL